MNKNSLVAFFLSFIPGAGHFYLNKKVRGVFYSFSFFAPIVLAVGLVFLIHDDDPLALALFSLLIWLINILDMVLTLIKRKPEHAPVQREGGQANQDNEKFYTILLSFIPGLGHFQLGLMTRGLTLLISFFGLMIMVFFVTILTHEESFLVFLGILPIIWIYNMFDMIQQLNRKQNGEPLVDRTIFEDFEAKREDGRKSKTIATILSIFPGAGHMYLGLQRRGLQLMAAFLLAIYVMDVLRLSAFFFLIPLIWFYSFFDALQKASKYGEEELEDIPIVSYFVNHQKWIGIGLLLLGFYYLFDSILLPAFASRLSKLLQIDIYYWYNQFFQTTIVCILLIGGGFKLLLGSKEKKEGTK
jgi:TM2 domain-containing membrane protein YozV